MIQQNVKHSVDVGSNSPPPRYTPKKNENMCSHRSLLTELKYLSGEKKLKLKSLEETDANIPHKLFKVSNNFQR